MSIYVSGSLAFDRIMNFPDTFDAHILPEKLHILNVSFIIDDLVERRGGTAGNIAYTLALMGERPHVLAILPTTRPTSNRWTCPWKAFAFCLMNSRPSAT